MHIVVRESEKTEICVPAHKADLKFQFQDYCGTWQYDFRGWRPDRLGERRPCFRCVHVQVDVVITPEKLIAFAMSRGIPVSAAGQRPSSKLSALSRVQTCSGSRGLRSPQHGIEGGPWQSHSIAAIQKLFDSHYVCTWPFYSHHAPMVDIPQWTVPWLGDSHHWEAVLISSKARKALSKFVRLSDE